VHAGGTESAASLEGTQQGCIPAATHSHAERLRRLDEVQFESIGVAIKSIGEPAKEPN